MVKRGQACMATGGGVCGEGGACMANGGGACVGYDDIWRYDQ